MEKQRIQFIAPKMKKKFAAVRAVACDLDGTLLNSCGTVSRQTARILKKARERGLFLILATGRDVESVKGFLREWGLKGTVDAVLGMGGAEFCDFSLGKEWAKSALGGELVREIMDHYKDLEVNFAIPWRGVLHAPWEDAALRRLSEADRMPFKVDSLRDFLEIPSPKVMIVCQPERMEAVIERSRTFSSPHFSGRPLKTASILFEYMAPGISKAGGLEELAGLHGFSMEEICAFGDADNDLDMIEGAGIGVAMANAGDKVREAADFVTGDNDSDGVAQFIEEMLLLA